MSVYMKWILCTTLLSGLMVGCVSTRSGVAKHLGITVDARFSNEYRITNITLDTLDSDSVKVFCRVQKEGKRARGFLEVKIMATNEETVFCDSVLSHQDTRARSYTQSDLGFPFAVTVPIAVIQNKTVHLAFIKDAINVNKIFKKKR